MKQLRQSTLLSALALYAGFSLIALCPQQAAAADQQTAAADQSSTTDDQPTFRGNGATYLITNKDSTGAFASRGVITIHADHTLSVIDSAQGGPTYYFGDQLGTWGVTKAGFVGRTINFTYPPPSGAPVPQDPVARLDYTFKVGRDGSISGTIALYYFPLTANPLGSGGTSGGTYTFTGYAVTLPD